MTKRLFHIVVLCLLFSQCISAQQNDSLSIGFRFKFDGKPLQLNQRYVSKKHDTLQISTLKFYVSDLVVHYQDQSESSFQGSHLVDFEIPASYKINFPSQSNTVKSVSFSIGVDSLANVSGALSGDLDPVKGMYWAWQSGYINFKIEGNSSSCNTRKNQFQFHLGGYLKPNNALRTITLFPTKNSSIAIDVDLANFFSEVSLSQINSIMIPDKRAMQLVDFSVKMFSVE